MAATGRARDGADRHAADDPRRRRSRRRSTGVMRDLAHQVVRDGEGATKFVEVRVTGAETPADARKVGLSIANSPLVKTAIAGEDPNWGRDRDGGGQVRRGGRPRPAVDPLRRHPGRRDGLGRAHLPRGRRRRLHEAGRSS